MKIAILIFTVIISILGIILSIFIYPLIASFFDASPTILSVIIGLTLIAIVILITNLATNDKYIRFSIIAPCILSLIASFVIQLYRFDSRSYNNGYIISSNWGVHDNTGQALVKSGYSPYWYIGINKQGAEFFVNIDLDIDSEYGWENDDEKYDYKIIYYMIDGTFAGIEEFSKYYDEEDEKYVDYMFDDAKYLIKANTGITIYARI